MRIGAYSFIVLSCCKFTNFFKTCNLLCRIFLLIYQFRNRITALLSPLSLKKKFQTALKYDANLNYIHNNLAIALEKAGFKEQAVEHYKINLKRHPDYADSYFNLGRIAYSESRYKQAIKLLSKANDLNPKFSDTQYILGLAYIKSGKVAQGCFYLHMAVENGNLSAQEAITTHCNSLPEEDKKDEEE